MVGSLLVGCEHQVAQVVGLTLVVEIKEMRELRLQGEVCGVYAAAVIWGRGKGIEVCAMHRGCKQG